jgi:hypothetical protein
MKLVETPSHYTFAMGMSILQGKTPPFDVKNRLDRMKKLYKYMSYRDGFFNCPQLRITQRSALNDPFECSPPEIKLKERIERHNIWRNKRSEDKAESSDKFREWIKKCAKNREDELEIIRKMEDMIRKIIPEISNPKEYCKILDSIGVVSLSSDCENVVMWSHYADDHAGLVVELDPDKVPIKNRVTCRTASSEKDGGYQSPQPVEYITNRKLSISDADDILISSLVKYEKWRYEKEYRIVCPLFEAETLIATECGLWTAIDQGISADNLFRFLGNRQEDERFHVSCHEEVWSMKYDAYNIIEALARDPTTLFLRTIPKESITKVILGCRMLEEVREDIQDDLRRGAYSAEIVQAKMHADRFSLEFRPVSSA